MCSGGVLRFEQALVLALLPFDPGRRDLLGCRSGRAGEPRLHGRAKLGLAPEPERERQLAELDPEAATELPRACSAG